MRVFGLGQNVLDIEITSNLGESRIYFFQSYKDIVEVCNRLKVDVKAIKMMAGCPDDDVKPEELEKASHVLAKQYVDMFSGLFSG